MTEIKWIKITTNMFDDEKIKLIDAMPERDTIFYIWMRLLVQAGKTNAGGYIFLNENVPYTEEMLSTIFNRPLNSVRLALKALRDFGMIQVSENHLIKISNWDKHQNVEGMDKVREQNRLRKQKQRAKIKELQAPAQKEFCGANETANVTSQVSHNMSRDSHALEVEGEIEVDNNNNTATNVLNENFMDFFNNNMGHLITPFEFETLQSYVSDGLHPSVITLALQEAVEAGKRDMRYIKTILNRWLENKLTTVEAVMADKRNFEDKKKKGTKNSKHSPVGNSSSKCGSKKESTFNAFKQRDYDFDDLKKKLLGWDKGD